MRETSRETWITGVGILSCLGEGPEAHWQALNTGRRPSSAMWIIVDAQVGLSSAVGAQYTWVPCAYMAWRKAGI